MSTQHVPTHRLSALPDIVCKYLNFLVFIKSCSPHTIRAYTRDLGQAFGFEKLGKISEGGPGGPPYLFLRGATKPEKRSSVPLAPIPPMTSRDENRSSSYLVDEDVLTSEVLLSASRQALRMWGILSPASRNRKAACLKGFFKWLFQEHQIETDISIHITCPKVPHRLPHYLSVDEILAVLRAQTDWVRTATSEAERLLRWQEYVLLLLLYGGGLRVSEACTLKWSAVSEVKRTVKVLGKGEKERLVAVPTVVIQALKRLRGEGRRGDEFVFGTIPLDTRKAYSMVRAAGARAGLIKHLHPHALRHSFATHLLSGGANLRTLQELLGHQSLQATQRYTHVSIDGLARTMEALHPLAKKPKGSSVKG